MFMQYARFWRGYWSSTDEDNDVPVIVKVVPEDSPETSNLMALSKRPELCVVPVYGTPVSIAPGWVAIATADLAAMDAISMSVERFVHIASQLMSVRVSRIYDYCWGVER
jgi:hypothetical protein